MLCAPLTWSRMLFFCRFLFPIASFVLLTSTGGRRLTLIILLFAIREELVPPASGFSTNAER